MNVVETAFEADDGVSFGMYSMLSFPLFDYVHVFYLSMISPPGLRFMRGPGSLSSLILPIYIFLNLFHEKETLVLPPLSKDCRILRWGRVLWRGIRLFFSRFWLPGVVYP